MWVCGRHRALVLATHDLDRVGLRLDVMLRANSLTREVQLQMRFEALTLGAATRPVSLLPLSL